MLSRLLRLMGLCIQVVLTPPLRRQINGFFNSLSGDHLKLVRNLPNRGRSYNTTSSGSDLEDLVVASVKTIADALVTVLGQVFNILGAAKMMWKCSTFFVANGQS